MKLWWNFKKFLSWFHVAENRVIPEPGCRSTGRIIGPTSRSIIAVGVTWWKVLQNFPPVAATREAFCGPSRPLFHYAAQTSSLLPTPLCRVLRVVNETSGVE